MLKEWTHLRVLTRHMHVLIFTLHWYLVGFEMFRNLSRRENSISVSLYENNIDLYENNINLYENNIDF